MSGGIPDLWSIASKLREENSSDENVERNIVVVGEVGVGKSSLIHAFIKKSDSQKGMSAIALEYTFGKREKGNVSQMAHFWEIGGGRRLERLLDVVIKKELMESFLFLIVVDLSKPGDVLESAMFWIRSIHSRCSSLYKNNKIPIMLVGNKYDVFHSHEAEEKRVMSKVLRYLCHENHASLLYVSNEATLRSRFRNYLQRCLFEGPERRTKSITDYSKPLLVPVGQDDIRDIGVGSGSRMDVISQMFKECFPQGSTDTSKDDMADNQVDKYTERDCDNLLRKLEARSRKF